MRRATDRAASSTGTISDGRGRAADPDELLGSRSFWSTGSVMARAHRIGHLGHQYPPHWTDFRAGLVAMTRNAVSRSSSMSSYLCRDPRWAWALLSQLPMTSS